MNIGHLARWKKILGLIIGGIFILLGMVVVGLHFVPLKDYSISKSASNIIQPTVQNQKKIVNEISTLYNKGKYTFQSPLVLQNPYGSAPLTALVMFETSTPEQISIHIPGKTDLAAIDYTFAGYSQHHEIPVYGLYAGEVNKVTLTAKDQNGASTQKVLDLKTESLPVFLDSIKLITSQPQQYSPGMNFSFLYYKEIFDVNGTIRWYSTRLSSQVYTPLKNGHYLLSYPLTNDFGNVVMEEDLLGKIYAIYDVPEGVQHDMTELPDGNILVSTQNPNSFYIRDVINEIDAKTGEVIQSFDLKKYLDPSRSNELFESAADWLHLNSILYSSLDQSLIISGRTQSAVVKFSYPSMQIQWILGPHDNWPAQFQKYLLTPVGDNFEWQWSQHDATVVSNEVIDGDKITNILLFDNGLYRSFSYATALTPAQSYSRVVLYQIDETKMTVRQLWQYGKERGNELFTASRGSAQSLSNGNYLGDWAEIFKNAAGQAVGDLNDSATDTSEVVEVNPSNNQVVFEVKVNNPDYRVFRADIYNNYTASASLVSIQLNDTTQMTPVHQIITSLQPVKKWVGSLHVNLSMTIKHFLQQNKIWDGLHTIKLQLLGSKK